MSLHPPVVRKYVPPSDEQVVRARAKFARERVEREAAREATRPARRAVILAGPRLSNVEAAVDCTCACHPRPADADRHDGGTTCPCQQTEEDRAARMRAFHELSNELANEYESEERHAREQNELIASEAQALGVEARIVVWAAPRVLVGICDGRGFYLRERHQNYRVTIAPDDNPGSDPWVAEPTEPSIDIAGGDEGDLQRDGKFSWVLALCIAVQAVRTAIARNACRHRRIGPEPFCPSCGVRIDEADTWRWTSPQNGEPT